MSLIDLLFGSPDLSESAKAALDSWRAQTKQNLLVPLERARFLVADPDVSGVDLTRDHARGIGLIVVEAMAVRMDTLCYLPLPTQPRGGSSEATPALRALLDQLGAATLVSYHARFADTMISRSLPGYSRLVGAGLSRLDLALLLYRQYGAGRDAPIPLRYWLERFRIANFQEHDAVCDAFSTAQLLLVALARAQYEGVQSLPALLAAATGPALSDS